jgi:hypothetical protein
MKKILLSAILACAVFAGADAQVVWVHPVHRVCVPPPVVVRPAVVVAPWRPAVVVRPAPLFIRPRFVRPVVVIR